MLTFGLKRALIVTLAGGGSLLIAHQLQDRKRLSFCFEKPSVLPKRKELMERLKQNEFDVLIIGGGATGAGVVYEASRSGLKAALIEKNDYSSGTSSKSTKLIHGGIRYLKRAIFNMDLEEYNLIHEGLEERSLMLTQCPNMVKPVEILLPCYGLLDHCYKLSGLILYNLIIRQKTLFPRRVGVDEMSEMFPLLDTSSMVGGLIYKDGQQDDSRMNVNVIKTSIINGAVACNYVEASGLAFAENDGKITGAWLVDRISGERFYCKTKVIVNATGPQTDSIRQMGIKNYTPICRPSSGVHVSVSKNVTAKDVGLILEEKDNRVLFVLPWQNKTIVGTTDNESDFVERPLPTADEVQTILGRLNTVLKQDSPVTLQSVESCWSGLRPLVSHPGSSEGNTASLSRSHVIETEANFISVSGGKWTSFLRMGRDTIKEVEKVLGITRTTKAPELKLVGSVDWDPTYPRQLVDRYGVGQDIADHLSQSYGTLSDLILSQSTQPSRLHPKYPYTVEEIKYILSNEYVQTLEDVISRRIRISFLNVQDARQISEKIAKIAKTELGWSNTRVEQELEQANRFLNSEMGGLLLKK